MANIGNGAVSGQVNYSVTAVSANYTALVTDDLIQVTTGSSNVTVTLPAPVAAGTYNSASPVSGVTGVGNAGQRVIVEKVDTGSGHAVVAGTLNVGATYSCNSQWSQAQFISDGTRWNLIATVS